MAVLYICDRCGNQTGPDDLRAAEFSIPPEPDVALDLCPACVIAVRDYLLRADGVAGQAVGGQETSASAW